MTKTLTGLTLYHGEPVANSLKALIPLHEKGLAFESRYVDLSKFEQHAPEFVAINPEGQVPVLVHNDGVVTHTTVMNEYLEDAFPQTMPLRPSDPLGRARMRYWNKFIDEQVMNFVSIHGWRQRVAHFAKSVSAEEFEQFVARIPLVEQQRKWRKAREGFDRADLDDATRKVVLAAEKADAQLGETEWLAGDMFTLADVNYYAHFGTLVERLFPSIAERADLPNFQAWRARVGARPGVKAALSSEDRTSAETRSHMTQAGSADV